MKARSMAVAAVLLTVACGPSLRRVHRASAYFEECYAADLDALVSDGERRACWQAWSRSYQIGASPERLDYVHERLAMLDPDRAAAIALSTGDDGSIETIDEGIEAEGLAPTDSTSTSTSPSPSAEPPPSPSAEPSAEPSPEPPPMPMPSEVAPPPDTTAAVAEARHAREHERHLHRGIVAPRTVTARCPCEAGWETCIARCTPDERGCVAACRREHTLCSRSCY